MSDEERTQLIARMGQNIGLIDAAIKEKDQAMAMAGFVVFMGAAGFLAQEISELNNASGN